MSSGSPHPPAGTSATTTATAPGPTCNPSALFYGMYNHSAATISTVAIRAQEQFQDAYNFLYTPPSRARRRSACSGTTHPLFHTLNTLAQRAAIPITLLYILIALIAGIGGGFAKENNIGFTMLGATATGVLALLLNTHDKIDRKDGLYLVAKGNLGIVTALGINLALHRRVLPTIMIGFCAAMLWQLMQHLNRRRKEERTVTKASAYTTGLLLDLCSASSAFGSIFYLNPSAIDAAPPITDPRTFWGVTYAFQALVLTGFFLKNHLPTEHQRKQAARVINAFLGVIIQTNTIASILFLFAQIALRSRENTQQLTLISNILTGIAALASLPITYYAPPGNPSLYASYLALPTEPSAPSTAIAAGTTPPTTISPLTYCKRLSKTLLKMYLYIGSVVSALIQLRNLLGFVYDELKDDKLTLSMSVLGAILGLIGSCYRLFAPADFSRVTGARYYLHAAGNIADKTAQTLTRTAGAAYTLSFIYGIFPLITGVALHTLLQEQPLPAANIIAGIIIVAAASYALAAKNMARVVDKAENPLKLDLSVSSVRRVNPLSALLTSRRAPGTAAPGTATPVAETTTKATAPAIPAAPAAGPGK